MCPALEQGVSVNVEVRAMTVEVGGAETVKGCVYGNRGYGEILRAGSLSALAFTHKFSTADFN